MKKIALLLVAIVASMTLKATVPDGYSPLDWTYTFPSWNDYPDIQLYSDVQTSDWDNGKGILVDWNKHVNDRANIIAEVDITEPSCIRLYFIWSGQLNVYLDNTLIEINYGKNDPFCNFDISAGHHQIRIEHIKETPNEQLIIKSLGIIKTPLITVNLLEPGSLGTEILYNGVERLQDVHNLKVIGAMNDDDVEKISMMKDNLVYLDLSEAPFKTLPDRAFAKGNSSDFQPLTTVILPEGLETIGAGAFMYSEIQNLNFPSTLKSIGEAAFYYSNIKEAILPPDVKSLPNQCFYYCRMLKNVKLPDNVEEIGESCFCGSNNMIITETPSKMKKVERYAFYGCSGVNFNLPSHMEIIGQCAFQLTNTLEGNGINIRETLNIPDGCDIQSGAFNPSGYTAAVLPVSYYKINGSYGYGAFLPTGITRIRLNSPTVVISDEAIMDGRYLPNVTLEVPSYLVNSYKLDPYWFNCSSITGFDTEEVDEWYIQTDLVLGARERMLGTPSIKIKDGASLKINGTDGMPINNLKLLSSYGYWLSTFSPVQFISNTDGVTITGTLSFDITFASSTWYSKTRWYYLSLPFDCKVSDIEGKDGGQIAIRYYDGASRAENGATGSWKNFDADAVIPAGTGFIVSNSKDNSTWTFKAVDNESKQYMTSRNMFTKALAPNPSANNADKGWNLVGNPYQCYYNIHKLNFSAPITVRDIYNDKYEAYSIIDDDYALKPNEAFFVQCPDGVASIAFPTEGRQLTAEITSQQGAPAHNPQTMDRRLTDIAIAFGANTDRTRVVINEAASTEYELSCDASKFMGDGLQIYSIGNDEELYAINERPMADGMIALGFAAPEDGVYTISLNRNNNEHVYLTDNVTGIITEITYGDYTFSSKKGTDNTRFTITFENNTTAVNTLQNVAFKVSGEKGRINVAGANGMVEIYDMAGKKVASTESFGNASISVNPGVYVVRVNGKVAKVMVK